MFTFEDISVYIFNWKKVSYNSLMLYYKINSIINNTTMINCDENFKLDKSVKHIQLDDSHYYGSQYDSSIKNVKEGNIFCVVVGDNITDINFENIFNKALETFNSLKIGIYSPNDKRSVHKERLENIKDQLYNVVNTDCGFWFIHPVIVKTLRNLPYHITTCGWGIDLLTIKECRRQGFLVVRDYSVETDQLDHTCGYDNDTARSKMSLIFKEYDKMIK